MHNIDFKFFLITMQIINLKYLICMVVMFMNHRQEFIRHGKFCKFKV